MNIILFLSGLMIIFLACTIFSIYYYVEKLRKKLDYMISIIEKLENEKKQENLFLKQQLKNLVMLIQKKS